jgi:hypothetical protein
MEFWDNCELSCEKLRAEMAGRAVASGVVLDMKCSRDVRRRPEAVEATSRERDAIVWVDGRWRGRRECRGAPESDAYGEKYDRAA